MKSKMLIFAGLIIVLTLSGCVTARVVEKERVDQEISGNQGYLMGNAPYQGVAPERGTRKFIKVDVELPPYKSKEESEDKESWGNQGYVNQGPVLQEPKPKAIFPSRYYNTIEREEPKAAAQPAITTYRVRKNDSLWKIAQRSDVYGDGNKWKKIYEANKEKIKNPNKLRPGIELIIP